MPAELRDRDWLAAAYADRSAEAIAANSVSALLQFCEQCASSASRWTRTGTGDDLSRLAAFDKAERRHPSAQNCYQSATGPKATKPQTG